MTTDHEPTLALLDPPEESPLAPAAASIEPAIPANDAETRHVYVHALSWLVDARRRTQS